tara:strand:+ start:309 stop:1238 length:930 start_codon:yes stop_codon:yes gene_type:complete
MAFRKLVGSYKDYNLSTHIIEDGYLAVDVDTGSLRIGDGVTPGGTAVAGGGGGSGLKFGDTTSSTISIADGGVLNLVGTGGVTATVSGDTLTIDGSGVSGSGGSSSLGDLTAVGSTLSSPSNADLTLNSSGGNVVIEGIRIAGTTISTEDSSPGVEISGNLIPSQNGVFTLGSTTRRWQTAFLAAETIDLGGATISSDGTGNIEIAATGATLPTGSKVRSGDTTQGIQLQGKTSATANRPIQLVNVYTTDGSTSFTDAELLAKTGDLELEFNGTIEEIPVYTEAGQTFTLADGGSLSTQYSSRNTLFQF